MFFAGNAKGNSLIIGIASREVTVDCAERMQGNGDDGGEGGRRCRSHNFRLHFAPRAAVVHRSPTAFGSAEAGT